MIKNERIKISQTNREAITTDTLFIRDAHELARESPSALETHYRVYSH
jgi:hypothetical protein